jgi:hypothetical protein
MRNEMLELRTLVDFAIKREFPYLLDPIPLPRSIKSISRGVLCSSSSSSSIYSPGLPSSSTSLLQHPVIGTTTTKLVPIDYDDETIDIDMNNNNNININNNSQYNNINNMKNQNTYQSINNNDNNNVKSASNCNSNYNSNSNSNRGLCEGKILAETYVKMFREIAKGSLYSDVHS